MEAKGETVSGAVGPRGADGEASWWPTRKWWIALISGLFTIAAHAVGSDGWNRTEWAELLTLGASLATAYGTKNEPTPGGVPLKKR